MDLNIEPKINYLFVYLENKLFVLVRVERQLNSFTYLQMTVLYFFFWLSKSASRWFACETTLIITCTFALEID